MRKALDTNFKKGTKELSIAGYVGAMDDDLSAFVKVLTRVNIMTYDINGAWNPQTGPNSPFKAPSNGISYSSGIQTWLKKGFPANKLTGGLPFYGRSTSKSINLNIRLNLIKHGFVL
jgi:chitinase